MKTLSDKINESLKESYTQRDENLDSIIDIIQMLYTDYFSDDTDTFEIETAHIGNTTHRKIIFQNKRIKVMSLIPLKKLLFQQLMILITK